MAEKPGLRASFRKLSFNQKILIFLTGGSFLTSVGSLIVAAIALIVASNTQDIKAAIHNLSELATQTKRQADTTEDQLAAVRDQVGEAKAQTKAIAEQTTAIKDSSDANIKAATAQQRMADVTAKAQTPNVDLIEVRVRGLTNEVGQDGRVPFTLSWMFRNTGGSAFTTKNVLNGLVIGNSLPEKMPGGSNFPGQDTVVTPTITSAFGPAEPLSMWMDSKARDALLKGETKVFFFARFDYVDRLGVDHSKCFGREIILKDKASYFAVPAGGIAYRCAT
jgi:hypothetical protein